MEEQIVFNSIDDVKKELRVVLARSLAKNQTIKELQQKLEDQEKWLHFYKTINSAGNRRFLDYIKRTKDLTTYDELYEILRIYEGVYYVPTN